MAAGRIRLVDGFGDSLQVRNPEPTHGGRDRTVRFVSEEDAARLRALAQERLRIEAERRAAETNKAELAELMVGHRVTRPTRAPAEPGATVFQASRLTVSSGGVERLKAVDFFLREGETLGIIGVSGNGQATLSQLMGGLAAPSGGEMRLFGEPVAALDVDDLVLGR